MGNDKVIVRDGDELTVDVLRWDEGWDFGCPCCVIRPVVQFSPNGDHTDEMVESLCETAQLDGFVTSEPTEGGIVDRQYPLALLKRRWREAWNGKEFPVRQYTAARYRVRFATTTEDGDTFLGYTITQIVRPASPSEERKDG